MESPTIVEEKEGVAGKREPGASRLRDKENLTLTALDRAH